MGDQSDILAAILDLTKGTKVIPRDVLKNFNLILNGRDHEISKNVSVVLDNFQPTSPLEKLLRTKLVDRYKVSSETWKLLMSNDSIYVNQALKFDWFFSNNEDTADFLHNIVPKLSYSTRLKILNRYALRLRNTAAGEAIYLGVKSRYGISTAALILPACGEPFIQDELCKFTTTLPRNVIMALLDKYPTLSAEYIEKLVDEKASRQLKNTNHYTCVFIKLSNHNFSQFLDLFDKHGERFPYLRLGRRQLKKLLKSHFGVVLGECNKFLNIFWEKVFFRRLSLEQFKKVYAASLLPSKSLDLFEVGQWDKTYSCLNYLKPSVSPIVLTSVFEKKYGRDCTSDDLLLKFPSYWLQHLPVEARVRWMDAKIPKMNDISEQSECIAYLPVELSMPRLKNLIITQSDSNVRARIATHMIKTVKFNACPSALKDIIAYMVKRFRNESSDFKSTVMCELAELDKLLLKLDLDDWAPILEFINILKLGGDMWYYHWNLTRIFGHLIHTCFLKNVDADPYFWKFVECDRVCRSGDFNPYAVEIGNHTPFQKNCIEWFLDEIPNMKFKSGDDYVVLQLLENICNYNFAHKQSKIGIPDWLMEDVQRIVANPHEQYFTERIVKSLKTNGSVQLYDRLLPLCFPRHAPSSVLCELLKRNPDMILSNADVLVKQMVNGHFREYSYFYRKCRLYHQYGIPSEIITSSLLTLEQKVSEDMDVPEFRTQLKAKSHAVQILALLQDSSTYLDLCSKHMPLQQKIEDCSKEVQIEYGIQRAVCKSLTGVSTPLETLSLLPKFTGGDYLKIVCGSLIGVCVRIPENIILPILEEWVDCPVSLRKHILRLVYNIAPIEYSIAAFKKLFQTERNTSLRLVLFLQVRSAFIAEPADDSYNTFISIVQQLTEDDKEILDKLFDMDNIHDAYISQYIELVWKLIDSKWTSVLPNGKKTLVNSIDKKMFKLLGDGVCDMLLEFELSSKLPRTTLSKFVCYYLLYCPSDKIQRHRLDSVMVALGHSIKTHWSDLNRSGSGHAFPIRHVISDATESLCAESVNSEEPAKASSILSNVKDSLLSFVAMRDVLKESIQLDVYALYLSLKGTGDESTYASSLADLYNNYIQQYESQFGYSLVHHLTSDIPMVSNTKLAHELLTNHTHPTCHILASEISSSVLSEGEEMPMYDTIIDILYSSKIPHVQASAAHYFRTLEASIAMASKDALQTIQ